MADFIITSLRGGMNNTDPSIFLTDEQVVLAENVEFIDSMLGERRLGTSAITLPSDISARDRVTFLFRHLPSSNESEAELWVLGVSDAGTVVLAKKTTAWTTITVGDAPTTTGNSPYRWQAVSVHGKLFIAYNSSVDRLHVFDTRTSTTALRKVGLGQPAAPTAADNGVGTYASTRYFRVRFEIQSGGTAILRSEPSATLTFTPSGTGSGARITKPASISENETHWVIEASTDDTNYYVLTTLAVGTTTYDDTTVFATGYSSGDLSEDIGDYALIPSARYLTADDDRLIWAGSWESDSLAARVGWTPVFGADGVGNDERFETDTDPFKDLDTYEGGPITGLSEPMFGGIWVFKQHAIYKLTRTGLRSNAYDSDKYTDSLGAIHGSVVSGLDETGSPCIYFLDHEQGPCRIGVGGIKRCGEDLRKTWELLNMDATSVACSSLYYPSKKQVYWNIAVSAGNTPTKRLVLHVDKSRPYADGVRQGWTLWTGNIAKALTMCLFSENIESNTTRSLRLVPFIGLEGLGLVHRCDTGNTDNSVAYTATITTKPYWLKTVLQRFIVHASMLVAKAIASSAVTLKVLRNFNTDTSATVSDVSLAASGTETDVIKYLDNFKGNELSVVQFQFTDPTTVSAQWQLNQLVIREEPTQKL
jgi:hypothetical protein